MNDLQYQDLKADLASLKTSLQLHVEVDEKIHASVKEAVEFMTSFKTALKVLVVVGYIGKWLASIAVGVAAIFALITFAKTGVPPNLRLD